jgi:hypothetical protein
MELPDLVRESLGEEDVVAGLRLGDEDLIVFTATRTVIYRGEGLLSDEGLSSYPFDFERLQADWSRRKATFTMEYVDGEREFSVPKKRGDRVLERLIEGSLRVAEVIEHDEAVTGVFRFSELTLVVTAGRLLKHVGGYTWDGDFETFDYDELTKLGFEEGSVATQIVIGTVGGRTDRIKAPNQQAGVVRKAIQEAVFDYHEVTSLEELNRLIEPDEAAGEDAGDDAGLDLDAGIDPLVGSGEDDGGAERPAGTDGPQDQPGTAASGTGEAGRGASAGPTSDPEEGVAALGSDPDLVANEPDGDLVAVTAQLEELTAAVERQNELLDRQQRTVQTLIEELRQGR